VRESSCHGGVVVSRVYIVLVLIVLRFSVACSAIVPTEKLFMNEVPFRIHPVIQEKHDVETKRKPVT
jgi:hypothetical protein